MSVAYPLPPPCTLTLYANKETNNPNRPLRCESKPRSFSLEGGITSINLRSIDPRRVGRIALHQGHQGAVKEKPTPLCKLLTYLLHPPLCREGRQVAARIENPGPQTTRIVVQNLRRFQYHNCLSVCTVSLEPLDSAIIQSSYF